MKISRHAYSDTSLSLGRDDEAKMAAQLRVLPLQGQEISKERMKMKLKTVECCNFCCFKRKIEMA